MQDKYPEICKQGNLIYEKYVGTKPTRVQCTTNRTYSFTIPVNGKETKFNGILRTDGTLQKVQVLSPNNSKWVAAHFSVTKDGQIIYVGRQQHSRGSINSVPADKMKYSETWSKIAELYPAVVVHAAATASCCGDNPDSDYCPKKERGNTPANKSKTGKP